MILGQTKGTSVTILKVFIMVMLEASNLFPQTCPTFASLKLNFHFCFKWAMYTKCLPRKHIDVSTLNSAESEKDTKGSLTAGSSSRQRPPALQQLLSLVLWEVLQGTPSWHAGMQACSPFSCFQGYNCDFQEFSGRFGKQRNRVLMATRNIFSVSC